MIDEGVRPARSLGSSAARGAAITMVGQVARILIQLVGIVVLARLLSPEDYGLLAMVLAIIGVGEVFRDFGLSSAAIQARTLSSAQRDNLFWINTLIGLVLAGAVVAVAFPIALLYSEPRLQAVTMALSVTFLFNGIATQHKADLTRQLQFRKLAIIEVAAPLLGLIAGVTSALLGANYWSLVFQQITIPLASLIMFVAATRWIPGWFHRGVSITGFVKFGLNLLGVQLLTYASRNTDSLVIGTRLGPHQLGLYDRAFQLLVLPLNQINAPATKVALPILSRLQDQTERFGAFVLRGQSVLVHLITAIFAIATAQAAPAIDLVLGPQWSGSTLVFQILAVGGVMQALSYATYWVFLAKGLMASNLRYALITRPVLIIGVIVGSQWGIAGVAVGYSVALILFWPFGLWWISRVSDAPALQMFWNGGRALVGYTFCGVASYFSTYWLTDLPGILQILIGLAAFAVALAIVIVVWPQFRRDVIQIVRIRSILKENR